MNNQKLISVIIPVYGVEKYIGKCLESVMQQTYRNLEIIVINDGTKDKSAEIAKHYASKDKRIKVYDFPNGGLSVARNRGLKLATGDYIAYLDSDDWIEPVMYQTLLDAAIKNNADMVKCGFYIAEDDKYEKMSFENNDIFTYNAHNIDLYFKCILWTVVWNALYTRELANKVVFPVNVIHEDNYSSGMFLYLSKRIVTLQYCGYYYRVNYSGLSKGCIKRPLDKIIAIKKLKDDLTLDNFYDKRLDWKISIEIYHFIRRKDNAYKVVAMDKALFKYICNNLDLRRSLVCRYIVQKIKIID